MADTQEIINITLNLDAAIQDTQKAKENVLRLTGEIEKLVKQAKENNIENVELTSEYIKYNAELQTAKEATRNLEKQVQKHTQVMLTDGLSIEKARANVQQLTVARNKLDLSTEDGKNQLVKLNAEIDKNNEFIKNNVDAYTKQKINIGNYAESIKSAVGDLGQFAPVAEKASTAVSGFSAIIKANPLSALIIGLSTLVNWFSQTALGGEILNKVMGTITGAFKSFGTLVNDIVSGKGLQAFKNFFTNVSKDIEDAKLNEKLKQISKDLDVTTTRSISKLRSELELLNKIADDDTKGWQERKKASKRAEELNEEIFQNELYRNKKFLQNVQNQMDALKQQGKIRSKEYEELEQQETDLLVKQNEINKEREQNEYDIRQKRRMAKRDEFEQDLDYVIKNYELNKEINQKKIDNDKATISEKNAALEESTKLNDKLIEESEALYLKQTQKRIDIDSIVALNDSKAIENKVKAMNLNEKEAQRLLELIEIRKKSRLEFADNEKKVVQLEIDLNKAAYETMMKANADKNAQILQSDKDRLLAQKIDYDNQLINAEGNITETIRLQKQKNAEMMAIEIQQAKDLGASTAAIEEKYRKANLKLEQAAAKAKLEVLSIFTSNIIQLFGEQSAAGKIAAVANTTVSTIEGAAGAFAKTSEAIPAPAGQIIGGIAAALVVANGIAAVNKILSTNSGLPGDSGSSGNVGQIQGVTASAGSVPSIPTGTAPEIGRGIVSRNMIEQQSNESSLQPVLILDEVTYKQKQEVIKSRVITI